VKQVVEELLHLVALAQAAALDEKRWVEFVRSLEQHLGGVVVWLGGAPLAGAAPEWPIAPSLGAAFRARYAEEPTLDPVVDVARSLPPGEVRRADELLPLDTLRSTRFASEWLAPQKLSSTRSLIVRLDGPQPSGFLRLFWPCRARPQLERSRQELSMLVEPLRQAIRVSLRLAELESVRGGLQSVVDGVPIGVLLLDLDGHVHFTNTAADRLLAQHDGLVVDRDGLRGSSCEGTRELRSLLRVAGAAGRAATLLPRTTPRMPLHAVARSLRSGLHPLVAVLVGDPEAQPELRTELLQCFHELTPAEASLAQLLAQGRDLDEAAEALGVTRQTVRSRLRDVFAKTGTCRQAALVERLLATPAFFFDAAS
jgi:DNA-binding CsgD family transcriptional regulator/PAS domain-containing protein